MVGRELVEAPPEIALFTPKKRLLTGSGTLLLELMGKITSND